MRQALVDSEDGLLRPGALPKVATATAAGNKSLLDAIEKAWNPNPVWFSEIYKGLGSEPQLCIGSGKYGMVGMKLVRFNPNIPKLLTWVTFNVPCTFGIRSN